MDCSAATTPVAAAKKIKLYPERYHKSTSQTEQWISPVSWN